MSDGWHVGDVFELDGKAYVIVVACGQHLSQRQSASHGFYKSMDGNGIRLTAGNFDKDFLKSSHFTLSSEELYPRILGTGSQVDETIVKKDFCLGDEVTDTFGATKRLVGIRQGNEYPYVLETVGNSGGWSAVDLGETEWLSGFDPKENKNNSYSLSANVTLAPVKSNIVQPVVTAIPVGTIVTIGGKVEWKVIQICAQKETGYISYHIRSTVSNQTRYFVNGKKVKVVPLVKVKVASEKVTPVKKNLSSEIGNTIWIDEVFKEIVGETAFTSASDRSYCFVDSKSYSKKKSYGNTGVRFAENLPGEEGLTWVWSDATANINSKKNKIIRATESIKIDGVDRTVYAGKNGSNVLYVLNSNGTGTENVTVKRDADGTWVSCTSFKHIDKNNVITEIDQTKKNWLWLDEQKRFVEIKGLIPNERYLSSSNMWRILNGNYKLVNQTSENNIEDVRMIDIDLPLQELQVFVDKEWRSTQEIDGKIAPESILQTRAETMFASKAQTETTYRLVKLKLKTKEGRKSIINLLKTEAKTHELMLDGKDINKEEKKAATRFLPAALVLRDVLASLGEKDLKFNESLAILEKETSAMDVIYNINVIEEINTLKQEYINLFKPDVGDVIFDTTDRTFKAVTSIGQGTGLLQDGVIDVVIAVNCGIKQHIWRLGSDVIVLKKGQKINFNGDERQIHHIEEASNRVYWNENDSNCIDRLEDGTFTSSSKSIVGYNPLDKTDVTAKSSSSNIASVGDVWVRETVNGIKLFTITDVRHEATGRIQYTCNGDIWNTLSDDTIIAHKATNYSIKFPDSDGRFNFNVDEIIEGTNEVISKLEKGGIVKLASYNKENNYFISDETFYKLKERNDSAEITALELYTNVGIANYKMQKESKQHNKNKEPKLGDFVFDVVNNVFRKVAAVNVAGKTFAIRSFRKIIVARIDGIAQWDPELAKDDSVDWYFVDSSFHDGKFITIGDDITLNNGHIVKVKDIEDGTNHVEFDRDLSSHQYLDKDYAFTCIKKDIIPKIGPVKAETKPVSTDGESKKLAVTWTTGNAAFTIDGQRYEIALNGAATKVDSAEPEKPLEEKKRTKAEIGDFYFDTNHMVFKKIVAVNERTSEFAFIERGHESIANSTFTDNVYSKDLVSDDKLHWEQSHNKEFYSVGAAVTIRTDGIEITTSGLRQSRRSFVIEEIIDGTNVIKYGGTNVSVIKEDNAFKKVEQRKAYDYKNDDIFNYPTDTESTVIYFHEGVKYTNDSLELKIKKFSAALLNKQQAQIEFDSWHQQFDMLYDAAMYTSATDRDKLCVKHNANQLNQVYQLLKTAGAIVPVEFEKKLQSLRWKLTSFKPTTSTESTSPNANVGKDQYEPWIKWLNEQYQVKKAEVILTQAASAKSDVTIIEAIDYSLKYTHHRKQTFDNWCSTINLRHQDAVVDFEKCSDALKISAKKQLIQSEMMFRIWESLGEVIPEDTLIKMKEMNDALVDVKINDWRYPEWIAFLKQLHQERVVDVAHAKALEEAKAKEDTAKYDIGEMLRAALKDQQVFEKTIEDQKVIDIKKFIDVPLVAKPADSNTEFRWQIEEVEDSFNKVLTIAAPIAVVATTAIISKPFATTLTEDLKGAGWRIAAHQLTKVVKAGVLTAIKTTGKWKKNELEVLVRLFNSPFADSVVATITAQLMERLPERFYTATVEQISKELRVQAFAKAGDELINLMLEGMWKEKQKVTSARVETYEIVDEMLAEEELLDEVVQQERRI